MAVIRNIRRIACVLLLLALIAGCIAEIAVIVEAIWPEASGATVVTKDDFTIDASNSADGYIMAKRTSCSNRLKLRISKDGKVYTYDLNSDGEYEVFPLQLGSGTYNCALYRNVKSNKYASDGEINISVELADDDAPFICPSQYVNYTAESQAVLKSIELCSELETDEEKIEAVRNFMAENFAYDYERARSNPGFYLGDVEGCYETKLGLCQDLACVAASMLRVQNIPTQLVIGYADKYYHAWISVKPEDAEEYTMIDITADVTGVPASTYTVDMIY